VDTELEPILRQKALGDLRKQRVSRVSREPLYLQAARSIEGILAGYGDAVNVPIPPETEMAAALGIARPTVRQALAQLQQAGRVYAQRGSGTFAVPSVLSRPARLTSLFDDLESQGLAPTTRVLELGEIPASAEHAAELDVAVGAPLVHLRRLRLAGGKPIALLENVLNLRGAAAPAPDDLEHAGLYATLSSQYGIELRVASLRVSATLATKAERVLLALPNPCAVLVGRRLAFDTLGGGIEIGTTTYAEGAAIDGIRLQR
jgi:DNA-binding GntR family transcriptional regulator